VKHIADKSSFCAAPNGSRILLSEARERRAGRHGDSSWEGEDWIWSEARLASSAGELTVDLLIE